MNLEKPRILALFDKSQMNGVNYWRLFAPLNAMIAADMVDVAQSPKYSLDWQPGALSEYDAIIFNRFLCDHSHRDFFDCAERDGINVIVDLDDWYFLPKYHMNYKHYKPRVPIIRENLKRANLVTVSTPYLADMIKQDIGVKCFVLPNAVDFTDPQFTVNKVPDSRVRFGWCGGATHAKDLALIADDIATLHSRIDLSDKYRLVLQGYVNNDAFWRYAANIFSWSNKAKADNLSVINAASVFNYAQGYNRFDVALAPLVDGEFENCKSELKCIEAGAFGLPIIASDVVPYRLAKEKMGDGVILVRNKRGAFLKEMMRLMNNPDEVKERGKIAFEAVRKHYNVNEVNQLRFKAFSECLA